MSYPITTIIKIDKKKKTTEIRTVFSHKKYIVLGSATSIHSNNSNQKANGMYERMHWRLKNFFFCNKIKEIWNIYIHYLCEESEIEVEIVPFSNLFRTATIPHGGDGGMELCPFVFSIYGAHNVGKAWPMCHGSTSNETHQST